jgi:hypothetical protein
MTTQDAYTLLGLGIGIVGIIGTIIAAWINVKMKLAAMEVKILELEKDLKRTDEALGKHEQETKGFMEKVDNKLGNIYKGIGEIKIALANKVDRD